MIPMKALTLEALKLHSGHELAVATWSDVNVALVCEDCQEILADWDQADEDRPPQAAIHFDNNDHSPHEWVEDDTQSLTYCQECLIRHPDPRPPPTPLASRETKAFALVGQAIRAYCEVVGITNDDRLDEVYEKVIDLLIDLTD